MKRVRDKYLDKYKVKDIHGLSKDVFLEYLDENRREKEKLKAKRRRG